MKIKLILAADENDPLRKRNPFAPLSLEILSSVAPQHHYELLDLMWDDLNLDYDAPVDLVGISYRVVSEKAAFKIADEFRKRGVTVVVGGPQPSVMPYKAKDHADAVVVGEAETLWPILLDDCENGALKSYYVSSPLAFDSKGLTYYQLSGLPDISKFVLNRKRNLFSHKYTFSMVYASRGCPINCDFCLVTDIFGKTCRTRPVEEVVKEINSTKGYYYLIDDTVFGRPSTYDYYTELYTTLAEQKKIRYWTGQANLDAAAHEKGREVIKKAVDSGFLYAAIGIESINESTLRKSGSFNKMGISGNNDVLQEMKNNIHFLQDLGIIISGWFVIGYEDDSIETYYNTLDFCMEMNIFPVFTPIRALPGSRLHGRLEQEGRIKDLNTTVSNVIHPTMNDRDVLKALLYANDIAYSKKEILKRTNFYRKKFAAHSINSVNDVIHKTFFTYFTQQKIRQINTSEYKKLQSNLFNK